ncbi:LOW QUALITY PROTEIN: probable protein phosphatase 2C 72 [Macadamia integrifolia]|uniref:LOW QUALITY PROTEIN: probable protein phosphatase 2C 72 n=1 Tax=Macadamia integrifolia TaxID=60698 RepID=UPI001C4FA222|nr:LOW QUALITY PROTEIN: probable protein phosphatase 2C 72 [Macadamia integrifolia]
MGNCSSIGSSNIEESKDCHENMLYIQESPQESENPRLCSLHSRRGKKGPNQDAAILYQGYGVEEGVFYGVFDGHGRNGHIVSKLVRNRLSLLVLDQKSAHAALNTNATKEHDHEDEEAGLNGELVSTKTLHQWKQACSSAFKVMDKELKLQENLDSSCSGTTAVTIIQQGEDLIIANLGDSRAVLGTITEKGLTVIQLTTDLKPSLPREAERIKKSNGRVFALKDEPHVQRVWLPNDNLPGLAMARAFGDFQLKDYGLIAVPDISYHRLTANDQFLVLATDGIWDVLSNKQVASIVWSAENEEEAAKAVVNAAVASWAKKFPTSKLDDCTVLCCFLQERRQNHHLLLPKESHGFRNWIRIGGVGCFESESIGLDSN